MKKKTPKSTKRSATPSKPVSRRKEHPSPEGAAATGILASVGRKPSFPIAGVGASAGGLEAFSAFLIHVPADPGMAFVLIQHLDPNQTSQLTDLLSKKTRMPVLEVNTDTPVEINHVYVIAPGVSLSMSAGRLQVEPRGPGRRLPIDSFLRSLAHEKTTDAIGIVLSGTASDGTLRCVHCARMPNCVICQFCFFPPARVSKRAPRVSPPLPTITSPNLSTPGNLRKSKRCRNAIVLIVTSSDSARDREAAAALTVSAYFRKPSEYAEFMKLGSLVGQLCLNRNRRVRDSRLTEPDRRDWHIHGMGVPRPHIQAANPLSGGPQIFVARIFRSSCSGAENAARNGPHLGM